MDKKFLEEIKLKKEALEIASKNLKKKFVGLDSIIDQLIDNISVWYMMPELQTRPLIVCLWGLTGVGKTDLVRSLVAELKVRDKFVEVQMDNNANSTDKIQRYLTSVEPEDKAVLLLDEIQRFRTINSKGEELQVSAFKDVWMLLSDGRFQSNSEKKMELTRILLQDLYWDQEEENETEDETPDSPSNKKRKSPKIYNFNYWAAHDIKNLTKTKASIEEIMKWNRDKKAEEIMKALKDDSTFEGSKYSKLLVIISGNLDEAYRMSGQVDDADIDADIFHEFSKSISIINIKRSLLERFKPEQIARFGNNHIIYPSLSKQNYMDIIKMNVDKFTKNIKEKYNIKIELDKSIYNTIYKNGVFPAQGVRPVLSTISGSFENYLPYFVFNALQKDIKSFKIYFEKDILKTDMDDLSYKVILSLDNIKNKKGDDDNILVAVHESGHAIVYSSLFGVSPTQIKTLTSSDKEGFVGIHMRTTSKEMLLNELAIQLAGRVAEEIVFGEYKKSVGAGSDIIMATKAAASYIRHLGFDSTESYIITNSDPNSSQYNTDIDRTNSLIEDLLQDAKKKARDILNSNKAFFKGLVNELFSKNELSPEEFIVFAKQYNKDIKLMKNDETMIEQYKNLWDNFEKDIKEKE